MAALLLVVQHALYTLSRGGSRDDDGPPAPSARCAAQEPPQRGPMRPIYCNLPPPSPHCDTAATVGIAGTLRVQDQEFNSSTRGTRYTYTLHVHVFY